MRQKLTQKCPSNVSEENFLVKCFKFFDIYNKQEVDFELFYRAVEKIGVIVDKDECFQFFRQYDLNGNGTLDYKEFSTALFKKTPAGGAPAQRPQGNDPESLVKLFREKIKSRGARGIIGLQRLFKIMDDDSSKSLNEYEFSKAIKDFRVEIPDDALHVVFSVFDYNRDGTINYDEFLRAVRGEMNDFRRGLAVQAFKKIDVDNSGVLDIHDIKGVYNAQKHPDVIEGKKSEEQVLMEFLDTFETHHNVRTGGANDHSVTLDEWVEYYNNISISIDDDAYF